MNKVLDYIESGKKEGAKLLCGGKRINRDGYFVEATVFADVQDDMKIAREEIFGPVMSIFKYSDLDEAIARANNTQYGLASGVFTANMKNALKVSREMQSGVVYVNSWISHGPATPFGGWKSSGIGRELGLEGL